MKLSNFFTIFLLVSLFLFCQISYSQTDTLKRRVAFSLGLGLVTGNDYSSAMKDYFSNVSGYLGWINVEIGADVRTSRRFFLYPNVKCLAGRVKITTSGFDAYPSEYANIILIPGLGFKFNLIEKGNNSVFINAGVGASICSSDFEDFIYKSDGVEKEAGLGYQYSLGYRNRKNRVVQSGSIGVRIGYTSIPILLTSGNNSSQQKDFGGILFTLYRLF